MKRKINENFFTFITADQLKDKETPEIATIKNDASILDALKLLSSKKIFSAPIEDKTKGEYAGSVSVGCINRFIINCFIPLAGADLKDTAGKKLKALENLTITKEHFKVVQKKLMTTPALNVIDSTWKPLHYKATLADVINNLTITHRCVIVDDTKKIFDIISQNKVVKFLDKNLGAFPMPKTTLKVLDAHSRPVTTVSGEESALVAFAHMALEGYSSMGISDKNSIVGVISLKDLEFVADDLAKLVLPAHSFISAVRLSITEDIYPTVSVDDNETLEKALRKLAAIGIHRLFIKEHGSDPDETPFSGLLSLSDVLRVLVSYTDEKKSA